MRSSSINVPKEGFADCLAIDAFEQPPPAKTKPNTSAGSKPSKSKTGASGDAASPTSDPSGDGKGASNDTPAQVPSKIAFEVLPSDSISVPQGSPAAPNIKLMGGTPPYYWAVIDPDDVSIVQASQNDLFVSLEAQPLNKDGGRVLVGDQAGAIEIVLVKQVAPPKSDKAPAGGGGGSNACCCCGSGSETPGVGRRGSSD